MLLRNVPSFQYASSAKLWSELLQRGLIAQHESLEFVLDAKYLSQDKERWDKEPSNGVQVTLLISTHHTIYDRKKQGIFFIPHTNVSKVTCASLYVNEGILGLKLICKDFRCVIFQLNTPEFSKQIQQLIIKQSKISYNLGFYTKVDTLPQQSEPSPLLSINTNSPRKISPRLPPKATTIQTSNTSFPSQTAMKMRQYIYYIVQDFDRLRGDVHDNIWTIRTVLTNRKNYHPISQEVLTWGLPSDVELERLSRFRYDELPISVAWGCWNPKKDNMFGAIFLRCGRPIYLAEEFDKKDDIEFNEAIDLELVENIYMHGYLLNTNHKRKQHPKIFVVDTGKKNQTLEKHYQTFCNFEFMDLSESEIDKRFLTIFEAVCMNSDNQSEKFSDIVKESKWVQLVTSVLRAATSIATKLNMGHPCIIQNAGPKNDIGCIISSLVHIFVDHSYRTIHNFCSLIEKEWFPIRNPIFRNFQPSTQFFLYISCVYELLQQQPIIFEFSEKFLEFLMDALYDVLYNGFVPSSENYLLQVIQKPQEEFLNPNYFPHMEVFVPYLNEDNDLTTIWYSYILRWNETIKKEGTQFWKNLPENSKTGHLQGIPLYWVPCEKPMINNITALSLVNCHISALPDSFLLMINLKKLSLEGNQFNCFPPKLALITTLKVLVLRKNNIGYLPYQIRQMLSLEELYLDRNKIASVDNLCNLIRLTRLTLKRNLISVLPPEFYKLTNLTLLDVAENVITYFSAFVLKSLTNLKVLSLRSNSLKEISQQISCLKNLDSLNLTKNSLTEIPSGIGNCESLGILKIRNNKLQILPQTMGLLTKLQELHLAGNSFANLPINFVKCVSLRVLGLQNNSFKELPIWLSSLPNLEELDLSNNIGISTLSHTIGQLPSLKVLNLCRTNLKTLPPTLGLCTTLQTIIVTKSSLDPPFNSISEKPTAEILKILRDKLKDNEHTYRMKVMLVGQENVGKTSLRMALQKKWANAEETGSQTSSHNVSNPATNKPSIGKKKGKRKMTNRSIASGILSTDGIDITTSYFDVNLSSTSKKRGRTHALRVNKKKKRTITVNFWDFAGQDVYYTTHQFFISSRAVYILVFNLLEKSAEARLEWWVQCIKARVMKPSLIIVGSHLEDKSLDRGEVAKRLEDIETRLRKLYQPINVKAFPVSCTTEEGINLLRGSLEVLICQQKDIAKVVKVSHLLLEEVLMEYRNKLEVPMISFAEFVRFAATCDIKDLDQINEALFDINELGSIIYFHNEPQLRDCIILDPQWLIQMMATLFTTKHRWIKSGILLHTVLNQIWKEYSPEIHFKLLQLLEKFEISHTIKAKDVKHFLSNYYIAKENISDEHPISDDIGISIIPALFPSNRPTDSILKEWSTNNFDEKEIIQIERVFRFVFLPIGLFARLIVRLLSISKIRVVWSHGLIALLQQDDMQGKIFVEHHFAEFEGSYSINDSTSRNLEQNELLVRVRGDQRDLVQTLFSSVIGVIESLTTEWTNLSYERFVSLPPDISSTPYLINISEVENLLIDSKKTIKIKDKEILLVDIAPDIALIYYKGDRILYSDLKEGESIGYGGFAKIFKGTYNGKEVAIKKLTENQIDNPDATMVSKCFSEFRHEIMIHGILDHPNIVKLLGICMQPFAMVMEYLPCGNLFDYVYNWDLVLPWGLRIKVAKDVAQGVKYMHDQVPKIVHMDLKSPNIMLQSLDPKSEVCAKIVDFGTSDFVRNLIKFHPVDNPIWLAPEALSRQPFDEKVDTYAYGVIAWELLSRERMFSQIQFMSQISENIISGRRPVITQYCPDIYRNVIEKCWDQKPEKRPAWTYVIEQLTILEPDAENLETKFGIPYYEKLKTRLKERQESDLRRIAEEQLINELRERNRKKTQQEQRRLLQALEGNDEGGFDLDSDPLFDTIFSDEMEYKKFRLFIGNTYSDYLLFYKEALELFSKENKNQKSEHEMAEKSKKLVEDLLLQGKMEETDLDDATILERFKSRAEDVRAILIPLYEKYYESSIGTLEPLVNTKQQEVSFEEVIANDIMKKDLLKFITKMNHLEYYNTYKKLVEFSKTIHTIMDPRKRHNYALEVYSYLNFHVKLNNHQTVITGIRAQIASPQFPDDIFTIPKKEIYDVLQSDLIEFRKSLTEGPKKRKESITRLLLSPRVKNKVIDPIKFKEFVPLEEFLMSPENLNNFGKFLGPQLPLLTFYEKTIKFKSTEFPNQETSLSAAFAIASLIGIDKDEDNILLAQIEVTSENLAKVEKILRSQQPIPSDIFDEIILKEIYPSLLKHYEDFVYGSFTKTTKNKYTDNAKYILTSKRSNSTKTTKLVNKDKEKTENQPQATFMDLFQDKILYRSFETYLKTHVAGVENLQCLRDIHDYRNTYPTNALKKASTIIETYFHPDVIVSIEDIEVIKEISPTKIESFHILSPLNLFDKVWDILFDNLQQYFNTFIKSNVPSKKTKLKRLNVKGVGVSIPGKGKKK